MTFVRISQPPKKDSEHPLIREEKTFHFIIYNPATGPIQPPPHISARTNSTELDQKDKKVIRDFVILLLFGLVLLYITYLNGNSFAVAPDQRREQTICIN